MGVHLPGAAPDREGGGIDAPRAEGDRLMPPGLQTAAMTGGQPAYHIMVGAPALLVFLLLCAMTVVSMVHPAILALTYSPILAAAIATASTLVALGGAYVALTEFMLYGAMSSLAIAAAFLVLAGTHAGTRLVPLLDGSPRSNQTLWLGAALDNVLVGTVFVMAAVVAARMVPASDRMRWAGLGSGAALVFAVCVALIANALHLQTLSATLGPLPPLIAAVLFFLAAVLFWRLSQTHARAWYLWLSLSLTFAGFAELQFAVRQYSVTVVQPGDVLLLVSSTAILLALAADWSHHYRGLHWEARELGVMHALTNSGHVDVVSQLIDQIERIASHALDARAHVLLASLAHSGNEDNGVSPPNGAGRWAEALTVLDNGPDAKIVLGVPLRTPNRSLGTLMAGRTRGVEFSRHDVRLLKAFGAQASILLERGMLSEELEAGAIRQERLRLAREIHDGLAQHLAFLKMKVALLQRSEEAPSRTQLRDVEGMLETALIEARHAIFTLRSELDGTSVAQAVSQYAEEFGQVSGVAMHIQAEPDLPDLGPKARVELLRIVQESLNNVRKYASASEVVVSMRAEESALHVMVADNGSGFDAGQSVQGHFGLEIMRERAESVGGRLSISSTPGHGTTIDVVMPSLTSRAGGAQQD